MWVRLGLSHPRLATAKGLLVGSLFRPLTALTARFGGVSMDALMSARHQGIDAVLTEAIESGRVSQVIEIAAGLSGRGWRFMQKYPDKLRYIETDLPHMAAEKRRLLARIGRMPRGHRVVDLDALALEGPQSLAAVAKMLDPRRGTAIITEGLINYFDFEHVQGLWARIAEALDRFPKGVYISDLYLTRENQGAIVNAFGRLLSAFVRGRMHIHFSKEAQAIAAAKAAGFRSAGVHVATKLPLPDRRHLGPGAERVRVLEARS